MTLSMKLKPAADMLPVGRPPTHTPSLTLTRSDIAGILSRKTGASKTESIDLLESMIDHITNSLIEGETVKLAGFGVFSTREKNERPGRNPKTGQPATVEARRVLVFKPSKKLKARVDASSKFKSICSD